MRKFYGIFLVGTSVFTLAQQGDSATLISEVRIEAYKKPTSYLASTKSVALATEKILQNNTPERLLESINHQTGTRMEEDLRAVIGFLFVEALCGLPLACAM